MVGSLVVHAGRTWQVSGLCLCVFSESLPSPGVVCHEPLQTHPHCVERAVKSGWTHPSTCTQPASRLLIKPASGVLASLRDSTYSEEYASPLRSLRPCWTAFLNSLQASLLPLEISNAVRFKHRERVCQNTAGNLDAAQDMTYLTVGFIEATPRLF